MTEYGKQESDIKRYSSIIQDLALRKEPYNSTKYFETRYKVLERAPLKTKEAKHEQDYIAAVIKASDVAYTIDKEVKTTSDTDKVVQGMQ